jgi:hypothetical protein
MDIMGGDLQLEGITKNQSFGLDERDKTADAILRIILAKCNPDGKLVYVVHVKHGVETIDITTRAAAAKRGEKFAPKAPASAQEIHSRPPLVNRQGAVDRPEQSPQGAIAGNQAAVLEPSDQASKTEGSRSKPAAEDASDTVSAPRSAVRDEAIPVEGKGAMRTDQRDRRADVGFGGVDTGRIKWSALISEETLTNEIRSQLPRLAGVVGSPAVFKSGGNGGAREGFSVVALMFGVIAAYDQDVRWKKDSPVLRDLFARAGFICTAATNQSFSESKARVVDLESLLAGGSLFGIGADQDEDFRWSQVAALSQLVLRLEAAVNAISDAEVAVSKGNFRNRLKHLPKLLHEAEVVAVIGEVIQQPDFEYHDDDTYRGYASSMRDAAICARDAANKGDGDTVRAAVAELKKSCEALHVAYFMLEVEGR